MKNIHFPQKLILISLLVVLSSCKKEWLDIKANKNLAVPSTLKDYQALLDNAVVMNLYTPGLTEIASDGHYISEVLWNQPYFKDSEKTAYTWNKTGPNLNVVDWNNAYQKIFYCNNVLDGLFKVLPKSNAEQIDWNNVKGQALFFRAINFYDLAQTFATPYVESAASTDLGIPLRIEADINILTKRSSNKETYNQIVNDLLETTTLLPNTPLYRTRPSKPAAFALLARIYLSMEDYSKAFIYADSCLRLYSSLIDFNNLDSTASLPLGPTNGNTNLETLFFSLKEAYAGLSPAVGVFVDTSLYALYSKDDLRKAMFFKNEGLGNIVFRGMYSNYDVQFSGLATDEVYLIRAECYARAGNTIEAMVDLNSLLRKRWRNSVTYSELVALNSDHALRQIISERRKELLFRGLRWYDLRRLNKDDRFKITIQRTIGGKTYTLEPNSYKYALPIPDDVIQATGIEQNNGW